MSLPPAGELTRGRPEAAAAIWPSLQRDDVDTEGQVAAARRGALLRWLVGLAAASIAVFAFERVVLGGVIATISTSLCLVVLVSPVRGHAAIDRVISLLGRVVGTTFTWLLLAPLFYLVITPFGWIRRRGVRDPLQRGADQRLASYWSRREDDGDPLDKPY